MDKDLPYGIPIYEEPRYEEEPPKGPPIPGRELSEGEEDDFWEGIEKEKGHV